MNPTSFDNVSGRWVTEIKKHCPNTPYILSGLKIDLRDDAETLRKLKERNHSPITFEQGNQLAQQIGAITYRECSARTVKGVKELFEDVIKCVLEPDSYKKKEAKPAQKKKCILM